MATPESRTPEWKRWLAHLPLLLFLHHLLLIIIFVSLLIAHRHSGSSSSASETLVETKEGGWRWTSWVRGPKSWKHAEVGSGHTYRFVEYVGGRFPAGLMLIHEIMTRFPLRVEVMLFLWSWSKLPKKGRSNRNKEDSAFRFWRTVENIQRHPCYDVIKQISCTRISEWLEIKIHWVSASDLSGQPLRMETARNWEALFWLFIILLIILTLTKEEKSYSTPP